MMNSYEPEFNILSWYSIDLSSPCANIFDFALKDFINSEYFEGNLLHFPTTPRGTYMIKDIEDMFDTFGRYIY